MSKTGLHRMAFTYFVEFLTAQECDCFLGQPDTVHEGALKRRRHFKISGDIQA